VGEDLGGRGEVELLQDVPLPGCQTGGVDHASHRGAAHDQSIHAKLAEQGFARHPPLRDGRIRSELLTVQTLQQLIRGQGKLEQSEEGLHPLGRFEEDRPHRQRCLPLMMQQFQIILLLKLPEQLVGTAGAWGRGDQGGVAIIDAIRLGCGGVEMKDEAVRGTVTAPSGRRQRRRLLRSQRQ